MDLREPTTKLLVVAMRTHHWPCYQPRLHCIYTYKLTVYVIIVQRVYVSSTILDTDNVLYEVAIDRFV